VFVCDPSIVMKDFYEKPCLKCQFRWVVPGGLNPMIFLNHFFRKKVGKVLKLKHIFSYFSSKIDFLKNDFTK